MNRWTVPITFMVGYLFALLLTVFITPTWFEVEKEAEDLIEQCEESLPRDQICIAIIRAEPIKK